MLAPKKHILCFDLDGTLINSKEAHAEAFNLAFEKNSLQRLPPEDIQFHFGLPVKEVIKKLLPKISMRKLAQIEQDEREFLLSKCLNLIQPVKEANETIEALSHKYVLALISTNKREVIFKLAKAGGIDASKFRIIIGEDEIKNPKPAPDGILKVKEYTDSPIEYMVGDTIYDIQSAKAAGIRAVGVLSGIGTFKQLWAEEPDHIISSIAELPNIL